jgi:hypothetical protein
MVAASSITAAAIRVAVNSVDQVNSWLDLSARRRRFAGSRAKGPDHHDGVQPAPCFQPIAGNSPA